jgi:hypothetical protein
MGRRSYHKRGEVFSVAVLEVGAGVSLGLDDVVHELDELLFDFALKEVVSEPEVGTSGHRLI